MVTLPVTCTVVTGKDNGWGDVGDGDRAELR